MMYWLHAYVVLVFYDVEKIENTTALPLNNIFFMNKVKDTPVASRRSIVCSITCYLSISKSINKNNNFSRFREILRRTDL